MKDLKVYDGAGWQSLKGPPGPSAVSSDVWNALTVGSDGLLHLKAGSLLTREKDDGSLTTNDIDGGLQINHINLLSDWEGNALTVNDVDGRLYLPIPPLGAWESVALDPFDARWFSTPIETEFGTSIQRRLVVTLPAGTGAEIPLPTASSVSEGQGLFVTAFANLSFGPGLVSGVSYRVKAEYLAEGSAVSGGRLRDVVRVTLEGDHDQDVEWSVIVDITYIEAVA